nr:retrovirus-related Pol polyprotein from transposon TNT 1-94 [Tanacetum cinerariifolium]
MCDKCVMIDKHDMCVLKSVAKPLKERVASESNKKPRNNVRKLYECLRKIYKWSYIKFTPSGYMWKPKSPTGNVNPNVSIPLGNASRTANVLKTKTSKWKSTCFIRDLKGNDLLTGSRGTDLYSITLQDTNSPNPICLMAKATSSQAWLWHRHHLCSSCELGKAKRTYFHSKLTPSSKRRLHLLHMDLCGPMRVASINRKRYVLVIVDDYSRYTWTHFLRSKDETPEVLIDFLRLVQRGLQAQVRVVRSDKGTKFLNQTLHAYFAAEGNQHQTFLARTPEQNSVVERRNRTLVEAARTMLSAANVPLFFWAEAIATACFTQNRSLVIPRQEKTPYNIINDWKPSVKFFHIFGSICYIVRDGENLDKMKEKGDECIFMGYSTQSRAYRVFNKRTRVIMESIHVNFDEFPQMASDQISSDPAPECQTMALEHDSLNPKHKCLSKEDFKLKLEWNRTLVEAARTMLSAAKVPLFFWDEAIATACFTQNRALVIPRHEKTPYHIINDRKQSVKFFYIFGSICYIVRDGENLDKLREKGDECIFVGYSNQSRAYRVFNKRARVIMESIHVNFNELPQMTSDQNSSDPAPECQTMALNHDSLSPAIQRQEKVTQADRTVTKSNELDLLFSPMFDELLNGSSKVVSKSSAVSTANAPNQRQQYTTPLNNHTTPAPTCQIPTIAATVISSENINQADTHAENDQVADDEFINIFSTPVQAQGKTSSRHVDSSNMHTFYQRFLSEHRWTKDHSLEQVIGNPSQSVRTRR